MSHCLFCEIIEGKRGGNIIYKDDTVIAFRDINPQAPVHILIVPKKHISTINDMQSEDESLVGKMFLAAKEIAAQEEIDQKGYRLVLNCNHEAGQSVYHLHLHLLGGRWMRWPPG
ncbi:MAG: histidine triad nucleotide-binding protein [bacterium]